MEEYTPLAELSPTTFGWKVRVRLIVKSPATTFTNRKTGRESERQAMELLDVDGVRMQAVAFGDVVQKLNDVLVVGGLYVIRGAAVEPTFGRTDLGPYQLTFSKNTKVERIPDVLGFPVGELRRLSTLKEIQRMKPNDYVDVVVCVKNALQGVRVVRVTGTDRTREVCNVDVVDETIGSDSVRVALWGRWATAFHPGEHRVMRILAGRLSPFQGELTIQTTGNTTVEFNPKEPKDRISVLETWFKKQYACEAEVSKPIKTVAGEEISKSDAGEEGSSTSGTIAVANVAKKSRRST